MKTETIEGAITDRLERALADLEGQIGARRHLQMRLLSELDHRQVPLADGARSLQEWVTARLDVTPDTARRLTQTAARLADQETLAQELQNSALWPITHPHRHLEVRLSEHWSTTGRDVV